MLLLSLHIFSEVKEKAWLRPRYTGWGWGDSARPLSIPSVDSADCYLIKLGSSNLKSVRKSLRSTYNLRIPWWLVIVAYTFNTILGRQGQVDFYEFEVTLVYSSRPARTTC